MKGRTLCQKKTLMSGQNHNLFRSTFIVIKTNPARSGQEYHRFLCVCRLLQSSKHIASLLFQDHLQHYCYTINI